ncbi:hypothetical protein H2204_010023 [Knufia peltigerae]|uniref:Sm protein F n=1 Tax=Knufia peltigerae TaxID=1002370 RepID=A0AA39CUI8_9EURO|nr:hypothetical protein H2204_010023 [Knufia peltigerae]
MTHPGLQSLIDHKGEWEATGIDSGTKFTGIDLSDGEWFDYDEKAGEEVSIKDIKWENDTRPGAYQRVPTAQIDFANSHSGLSHEIVPESQPVTMNFTPLNPRPLLQNLINDEVIIRLKWGQTEYKGRLVSVDSYMNIQLSNTEEYIDRKHTGTLGEVLIRCNNVLWISAAKGVEMNGEADTNMEG